MRTFPLSIGTPDGLLYEGEVERVKGRSITGDLAILAGHANYCTALGMGEAYIKTPEGEKKRAACIGGMLTVIDGECHLLATTWEWRDEIDVERAKAAKQRAEDELKRDNITDKELRIAEAKLHRALVRISVSE